MLLIGEKTFMKETKYFLFIYFLEFQLSFVYFNAYITIVHLQFHN